VPKVFLDANFLVYQLDKRYPAEQRLSRYLARELARRGEAVISTQVLQEFYVVATSKLKVDPVLAKAIMNRFTNMEVVTVTTELIDQAADLNGESRLSFWDALIVTAAASANCESLLTEDLKDGQTIRGVKVNNPYSKAAPR
jgi:predicted nucleic acid-binding protein